MVVSGPGGVGKGTVCSVLRERHDDLWLSRSWTTRPRRQGEAEDAYVFVTEDEFLAHVESGGFIEHAEFLGNYYGTPLPDAPPGRDLILEIDVQGARQIVAKGLDVVLIFLEAPSVEEQETRLRRRGDPEEKVAQRLAKAREEADAGNELGARLITNIDVDACAEEIYRVISEARAERSSRQERMP